MARLPGEKVCLSGAASPSRAALAGLRKMCEVVPAGSKQIDAAITSKGPDFEDAYQSACALSAKATIIITRDRKGFKHSGLIIMTPGDFLASYAGR